MIPEVIPVLKSSFTNILKFQKLFNGAFLPTSISFDHFLRTVKYFGHVVLLSHSDFKTYFKTMLLLYFIPRVNFNCSCCPISEITDDNSNVNDST